MTIKPFNFSPTPNIIFGAGLFYNISEHLHKYSDILLITGNRSFKGSRQYRYFFDLCSTLNITVTEKSVTGEPSPEEIDSITQIDIRPDLVIAIGGGSVIDVGKAVSAMIGKSEGVKAYLEGVGTLKHDGTKVPFLAIPTTSGTGSEVTKNAVISEIGRSGFKKSLRHENFIPNITIIDPELTISCPKHITASCGLDAFTQLLEAYTSTNSSPMTDILALDGIKKVKESLLECYLDGSSIKHRSNMAYASMLSGIVLANAGLGVIHGFASPLGAITHIPHGVTCGTLLKAVIECNIKKLKEENSSEYLNKYAVVGRILADNTELSQDMAHKVLLDTLSNWITTMEIKPLSFYGIKDEDFEQIIKGTGLKFNPAKLDQNELLGILKSRL